MSDANLLLLSIGPASMMVAADRESKGISEAQLARKWEIQRSASTTPEALRRRVRVDVAVDCGPTLRVECRRTSS
jgi:hypothetical protein